MRPGYDYLLERKLSSFWREIRHPLSAPTWRFLHRGGELGFTDGSGVATASQVPARLLIQTGRRLDQLSGQRFEEFTAPAGGQERTGKGWRHYPAASNTTGCYSTSQIVDHPRPRASGAVRPTGWRSDPAAATALVAYLERKRATCATENGLQPGHPARSTSACSSPTPTRTWTRSPQLDRAGTSSRTCTSLTPRQQQDRRVDHRRRTVPPRAGGGGVPHRRHRMGLDRRAARRLVFRDDIPKLPKTLPRYLPVDADRRLTEALQEPPGNELAACALLLQRACGLRIGELLDLELDCVHEVPGQGAWLKVPLGKLDTERMVPLDEETLDLVDHIAAIRSPGRPLPHPRTGAQPSSCSPITGDGCPRTPCATN